MSERFIEVRLFASEAESLVAQAVLRAEGISLRLVRDDAGGMHPELAFVRGIGVAVPREHEGAARRALETTPGTPA